MTCRIWSCSSPSANLDSMKTNLSIKETWNRDGRRRCPGKFAAAAAGHAGRHDLRAAGARPSQGGSAMIPMKHLHVIQGEDPSVVNRPKSILAESDIVCFGDVATLVPKRAILQIPKNYADRIQLATRRETSKLERVLRCQPWLDHHGGSEPDTGGRQRAARRGDEDSNDKKRQPDRRHLSRWSDFRAAAQGARREDL